MVQTSTCRILSDYVFDLLVLQRDAVNTHGFGLEVGPKELKSSGIWPSLSPRFVMNGKEDFEEHFLPRTCLEF